MQRGHILVVVSYTLRVRSPSTAKPLIKFGAGESTEETIALTSNLGLLIDQVKRGSGCPARIGHPDIDKDISIR